MNGEVKPAGTGGLIAISEARPTGRNAVAFSTFKLRLDRAGNRQEQSFPSW